MEKAGQLYAGLPQPVDNVNRPCPSSNRRAIEFIKDDGEFAGLGGENC